MLVIIIIECYDRGAAHTLNIPFSLSTIFAGLMSRCATKLRCMYSSAIAVWKSTCSAYLKITKRANVLVEIANVVQAIRLYSDPTREAGPGVTIKGG